MDRQQRVRRSKSRKSQPVEFVYTAEQTLHKKISNYFGITSDT
jgi:hypothetical protein